MKTIKHMFLVIALTASLALADDGHTGNGTRCDTCTPPPCTENCGGLAADEPVVTETGTEVQTEEQSLIEYWSEVFFDLVG